MLKDDLPPSGVAHTPARRLASPGRRRCAPTSRATVNVNVPSPPTVNPSAVSRTRSRSARRAAPRPSPSPRARRSRPLTSVAGEPHPCRCRRTPSAPRPSTARAAARSTGSRPPSRRSVPRDYVHTTPAQNFSLVGARARPLVHGRPGQRAHRSRCRTRAARCSAACASRSRAARWPRPASTSPASTATSGGRPGLFTVMVPSGSGYTLTAWGPTTSAQLDGPEHHKHGHEDDYRLMTRRCRSPGRGDSATASRCRARGLDGADRRRLHDLLGHDELHDPHQHRGAGGLGAPGRGARRRRRAREGPAPGLHRQRHAGTRDDAAGRSSSSSRRTARRRSTCAAINYQLSSGRSSARARRARTRARRRGRSRRAQRLPRRRSARSRTRPCSRTTTPPAPSTTTAADVASRDDHAHRREQDVAEPPVHLRDERRDAGGPMSAEASKRCAARTA